MTDSEKVELENEVLDEALETEGREGDAVGGATTAEEADGDRSEMTGDEAQSEAVAVDEPEDSSAGEGETPSLQAEYDALNDRHLRLAAEFNNFRRRSEQERLGAWSRAQADLVENFLEVLDDLHRVAELDLENATVQAIMEGIDLVERKFVRMLHEAGVEVIEPTGQRFDPETMEAMMRVPAESEEQADTVAQVFQKGYSLKGILIRPARVSVYMQG